MTAPPAHGPAAVSALPTGGLQVLPVRGIPDVLPGDDLTELITTAAPWLRDGDVLVVTSKIVSKSEGRLVDVPADGPERDAAREAILATESTRIVARRGRTAIAQTRHGFVMASAGIDASNVDKTRLVLLPLDPDRSARTLRATFADRHGLDVAVIISDTAGRPWRNGQTDIALGAAGIASIRDHRGEVDPYGNELHVTQIAVTDELAAAAELVKGKRDQVPVAVVRGYPRAETGDGPGAAALVREPALDLFSAGTAEAHAMGLRAAATLPERASLQDSRSTAAARTAPADVDESTAGVERALATVTPATGTTFARTDARVPGAGGALRCVPPPGAGQAELIRFGADVHRLRAALAAEGILSTVVSGEDYLLVAFAGPG